MTQQKLLLYVTGDSAVRHVPRSLRKARAWYGRPEIRSGSNNIRHFRTGKREKGQAGRIGGLHCRRARQVQGEKPERPDRLSFHQRRVQPRCRTAHGCFAGSFVALMCSVTSCLHVATAKATKAVLANDCRSVPSPRWALGTYPPKQSSKPPKLNYESQ